MGIRISGFLSWGKKKGQDKELPLGVMVELREHNKKTSNFERLWVTEVCAFVKT